MALKAALYRGPSSRLETLIEKIQANNKEINSDACSMHTSSPSFSPSISEEAATPNSTLSQRHHKYFTSGGDGGGGVVGNNFLHHQPPFPFFSLSDEEANEREIIDIEETERSYSLPPSFLSSTNKSHSINRRQRHLLVNNNNNHSNHSYNNNNHYHLRRPINHDLMEGGDEGNFLIGRNTIERERISEKNKDQKDEIDNDVDDDDETRTTTTTTTTSEIITKKDEDNSDVNKSIYLRSGSQKRKRNEYDDDELKIENNNNKILGNNNNNNNNRSHNNDNKISNKLLNSNNNNNIESININTSNSKNSKGILLKDILKKNAKLADKSNVIKNLDNNSNNNCNGSNNNNPITTGSTTDGSYQCQFCDKSFPRLGYLKKHEQSHAEHLPFKCEYCARLFKHKRSRDRHTKLHTGDRRYRCPHCEAAFSRSDHLKIHMKTHDNQKPFQCTICNRGYNTAAALTSHIQNHKKQAALMGTGLQPLNYSPRSTGSTSSSAGSLFGMRHQKSPLSMSGTDYGSNTGSPVRNDSKSSMHHQNLSCLYCTQNGFNDLEQLNAHIQTLHKNLSSGGSNHNESFSNDGLQNHKTPTPSNTTPRGTPTPTASITPALTPIPSTMMNFPMNCDYCTMKFTNISSMFQHMKTAHIDQMAISNFENFDSLSNSFGFHPNFATSPSMPQLPVTPNCFDEIKIKKESPSPNSNKATGGTDHSSINDGMDKDENLIQLRPTDLSQPKKHSSSNNDSPSKDISEAEKFFHRTFLCNQCNEALPDFNSFRNHLKLHITQKMGMMCQHCGIALHDKTELDRHVLSHFLIETSEFGCSKLCKKTFTKVDDLRNHLFEQHVQIVYKCTLCTEVFDTKIAIQVHQSCAHVNETKNFQCSACIKQFRNEEDFSIHVKSHLTPPNGCIQCMFCRTICTSQLEMHFHLAAHTQQFRCPSCPETFQVEFLLERHMQTHHHSMRKDFMHHHHDLINGPKSVLHEKPDQYNVMQHQQRQQSPVGFSSSSRGKNLFQIPNSINLKQNNKFYSPLQGNINANNKQQLKYGINQRFDTKKSLLNLMYNNYHHLPSQQQQQQQQQQQEDKLGTDSFPPKPSFLLSPTTYFDNNYDNMTAAAVAAAAAVATSKRNQQSTTALENHPSGPKSVQQQQQQQQQQSSASTTDSRKQIGFSCGMCERNDFRTESEVNTHRKIVHNLKTGVSLRCAYCSGNFKSRSELEHHMKACHNSMGKHKCLICDEIFPSPAILAEHKLQHSRVGRSGKCVHCSGALNDIATFKLHLSKHAATSTTTSKDPAPIQCICCRQTLNSDFEIELHARYHTKTPNAPENGCVLCLEPLPSTAQTRLCDKCDLKHKLNTKNCIPSSPITTAAAAAAANANAAIRFTSKIQQNYSEFLENKCNLCKIILPHQQRLQEHLVEHTFAGCEERGYSCYICSSVFTVPGGLLNHMNEHGPNARPYDCNICQEKFFFRAELDHHLIKHQLNDANDFMESAMALQIQSTPIDMIKSNKESKNNFQEQQHQPTPHHQLHHQQQQQQQHREINQERKVDRNINDLIKDEEKQQTINRHNSNDNNNISITSRNKEFKLQETKNDILKTEIKIENKTSSDNEQCNSNNSNEGIEDTNNNEEDEYIEIEKLAETSSIQDNNN